MQAFSVLPPNTTDESRWIDETVKFLNVKHKYLDISKYNIIESFDEIIHAR